MIDKICNANMTMEEKKLTAKFYQAARQRPVPNYTSVWASRNEPAFEKEQVKESLILACDWLINCCMCPTEKIPPEQNPYNYSYSDWTGAAREYDARKRLWHVFGPLWHTGQMTKALVLAYQALGEDRFLHAAKISADFIVRARISDTDDTDYGAILAQENAQSGISNTSCMLESLDGLVALSEYTNNEFYWQVVLDALDWARRKLFLPDEGLFLDDYDFKKRKARSAPNTLLHNVPGRPLVEDGIYLKAYKKTGNYEYHEAFFKVADRLLEEESPSGNWIKFPPCDQIAITIGLPHQKA